MHFVPADGVEVRDGPAQKGEVSLSVATPECAPDFRRRSRSPARRARQLRRARPAHRQPILTFGRMSRGSTTWLASPISHEPGKGLRRARGIRRRRSCNGARYSHRECRTRIPPSVAALATMQPGIDIDARLNDAIARHDRRAMDQPRWLAEPERGGRLARRSAGAADGRGQEQQAAQRRRDESQHQQHRRHRRHRSGHQSS